MELANINFPIGSVNPSGIKDIVYFIPKEDITAWPTIVDNFQTAPNAKKYTVYDGDFTLATGKHWIQLYTTQGKGKITFESTGETDCKMFVNKASLSYPKITDDARALAKYAANGDFVFCIKHDGKYYIIGSPDYRATISPNGDSGDAPGSSKGIPLEIECPDTTPLPVYEGTLVLSDGSINCSGATQYTVTYDGNGATSGTPPTDTNSPYNSGATVTVLGNTGSLTKTSKTFGGWNTKADGTGTNYAAAATFTISENTTLYAKWTS